MLKTVLIIVISVAILGIVIFVMVKNLLKKKLEYLIKRKKN